MVSTPGSNASSSDLYSPSDRAEEDLSQQLRDLPSSGRNPLSPEDKRPHTRDGFEEDGHVSDMYTPPSVGNGHSTVSDALTFPGSQILSGQTYHKRKREDDDGKNQHALRQPSQSYLSDDGQSSSRTISLDAAQPPVVTQEVPHGVDWPGSKRPRLEIQESSVVNGDNPAQPSGLPVEIWQHVFSFVPPVFLGRLLRVNRAFHAYLTSAIGEEPNSKLWKRPAVQPKNANDVWTASRRRFARGVPKPLVGSSELDMWRLLRGRQCQICGESKVQSFATGTESPLESGPGDKSLRVIWPFGVRLCGPCLHKCSEKESVMFVSADCPYFLLSALPFAFITATNHFVSNAALQGMAHLPPLKMEKHYYRPHIEDIKRRLSEARALGPEAAEEWSKGLSDEGKSRVDDAIRWETWEAKGGLKKVNSRPPPRTLSASEAPNGVVNGHTSKGEESESDRSIPHPAPISTRSNGEYCGPSTSITGDPPYPTPHGLPQYQATWPTPVPYNDTFAQRPMASFPQPRPERNIRDVNEAKAARKAEIERRCGELDPPLLSNILNHMNSFQAATQISQTLTDHAWDVLKPRLLAEKPFAERKEEERIRQAELLEEEYKQRRQQEAQLKETKEALDREWDSVQAPVRNKIGALADEIISENWSNGDSVSKDTSPKFAADVLMFVRERFYADIACEDDSARAAGESVKVDQPNEPPTRKLILENMKWLFDTKIKPLTENYQKELFLCNGCEGNFKFYGFEGVVQHYAAKHTNSLSMGSVVVHWRAEWPEHPPFHPNPSAAKAAYYKIPTPVNTSLQAPAGPEPQVQAYYGAYGHPTEPGTAGPPPYDGAQAPPSAYPTNYASPQPNGGYPYPPAQGYPPYSQVPQMEQGQAVSYPSQQNMYPNTPHGYNGYAPPQYPQPSPAYGFPYGQPAYSAYPHAPEYPRPGGYAPEQGGQYYGAGAVAHPTTFPPRPVAVHPSGLAPDVYQKQLDELAKQAREIWFGTSGIKDIPQSVRIFVVIHHVASRFAATYTNEPSLAMFIDGLDNHAKMRPVRSLNGLACKTCVTAGSGSGPDVHAFAQSAIADRRLFTLPHLLNHFRSAHVDDAYAVKEPNTVQDPSKPDWKRDMIELPELPLIADLINAPGMDDAKLALVAAVFPNAFPSPLPRMGKGGNSGPLPAYKHDYSTQKAAPRITATQVHPERSSKQESRNENRSYSRPYSALQAQSPGGQSTGALGEDEYDPHRPAYLGTIVKPENNSARSRDDQYRSLGTTQYPQYGADSGTTNLKTENLYPNVAEEQRSHSANKLAHSENAQALSLYAQLLQNGTIQDGTGSKPIQTATTSPSEAADQFLNNIPISRSRQHQDVESYPQDTTPRSASYWQDSAVYSDRQQGLNNTSNADRWNGDNLSGQYPGSRSPVDAIRAAQSISRAVDDLAASQRAASQRAVSKPRHDDEYQPPSHVQIDLSASRAGQSPRQYDVRRQPEQYVAEQQYTVKESSSRGDRTNSYQQTREPYYRSRSRSPQTSQLDRGYYRARSPRDDRRQETMYRVISPSVRPESQVQRVMSGEYAGQPRYQYFEERIPMDDHYSRRVEYVPVRYGEQGSTEPGRYVQIQHIEEPPAPRGYVRIEPGYSAEQIYDRNGHIYRAESAAYHTEQYRGPSTYAQEYRY